MAAQFASSQVVDVHSGFPFNPKGPLIPLHVFVSERMKIVHNDQII